MAIPTVSLEVAKARLRRDPSLYGQGHMGQWAGLTVRPVKTDDDAAYGSLSGVTPCRPSEAEAWGVYAQLRPEEEAGPLFHVWLEDFATFKAAWGFLRALSEVAATTLAANP